MATRRPGRRIRPHPTPARQRDRTRLRHRPIPDIRDTPARGPCIAQDPAGSCDKRRDTGPRGPCIDVCDVSDELLDVGQLLCDAQVPGRKVPRSGRLIGDHASALLQVPENSFRPLYGGPQLDREVRGGRADERDDRPPQDYLQSPVRLATEGPPLTVLRCLLPRPGRPPGTNPRWHPAITLRIGVAWHRPAAAAGAAPR